MTRRRTLALGLATAASLLSLPAVAAAKPLTVSGKLDHRGYAVVALGYNGKVAISRKQSFRLTAPDRRFTLQLLTAKGAYGGPVIVGYKGKSALEGLTKSVNLGTIKVQVAKGYATLAKPLKKSFVDQSRGVNTKGKVPLGNGKNFGFVRSRGAGGTAGGLDQDNDGVPNLFDVARNGKLVLNALAPARGTRGPIAHIAGGAGGGRTFDWMSQMFLPLEQTLNADAADVTKAQIDATLVQQLNLKGLDIPTADLVELDCTGLSYCSPGASSEIVTGTGANGINQTGSIGSYFDASGFVELRGPSAVPLIQGPGGDEFSLMPRATSSLIKTGDAPILRTTTAGVTTLTPAPIDFVFNTVPALASYSDSAADQGTIVYPADGNSPGTRNNPIKLKAGADGHVVLTMTIYRPQRAGIAGAGEPQAMDVGHLAYWVDIPPQQILQPSGQPGSPSCPADSLSTTDPSLSIMDQGMGGGAFVDQSDDKPASPANTLTLTVDLTRCLADKGQPSFTTGVGVDVELRASAQNASDHANQVIFFQRES